MYSWLINPVVNINEYSLHKTIVKTYYMLYLITIRKVISFVVKLKTW